MVISAKIGNHKRAHHHLCVCVRFSRSGSLFPAIKQKISTSAEQQQKFCLHKHQKYQACQILFGFDFIGIDMCDKFIK